MKAARKKRGWVYRGAMSGVVLMMLVMGMLWVASFTRPVYGGARLGIGLFGQADRGCLYFVLARTLSSDIGFRAGFINRRAYMYDPGPYRWWHFTWHVYPDNWMLTLPAWLPPVVLSIWPTTAAIRRLYKRSSPGFCTACDYDLRGSKQSATCPECGEGVAGMNDARQKGT